MTRYAVVDKDATVTNVIEWDEESKFSLPEGLVKLGDDEACVVGSTFDGVAFTPPPEPVVDLDQLKTTVVTQIDAYFRNLQTSVFVDAAKREAMRASALEAIALVRAAADADGVAAAARQAIEVLNSHLESNQ